MPIENSKKKKVTVVVLATIVLVTAISLAVTMLPLDPNSNSNSSSSSTASRDNIALSNTNTKTNANSNSKSSANSAGLVYRALPDPSESKHPGGYCQDGSRAGYFIREGMPESKLFVIYLAGGGGCGTQEACDARGPRYSGNSMWITDREGGLQKDGFLDADCSKNPTFCEGTAVHVPYCTSDSHMGNNTQINDWGYYFDGHANFAFIVEELIEYYGLGQEGATVMLTGGSAGGRGAIYNVDWLADRLNANSDSDSKSDNPSTNVKVVSNCGWYLPNALPEDLPGDIYPPSDYENFAAGTQGNDMYLAAQMGVAGEIESQFRYHDLLPDDCLEVYRDDPIACLSSSNHYRFLKTPLFLSHTQYDKNQIFTQMRAPQKPESEAELATTESYIEHWGAATRASFQRIVAGDHLVAKEHPDGLFSASCIAHGSPLGLTIGTGSENGNGNRPEPASSVAWQTIAHDWFFQLGNYAESHQLIEDCGARASDGKTVPCNSAPVCQFPFLGGGGGGGGDMDDIGDKNSLECLMKISQTGCVVSYGTFEDCEDCLKEKVADASAIEKQNMMKVCDTEIASKACLYASQNDLSEIDRDTVSDILNARGTGS